MTSTSPRLRMLAELDDVPVVPPPCDVRAVTALDAPALGLLAFTAYRGTVDDEAETLDEHVAEMTATIAGRYGPWLASASRLVRPPEQPVASAVLVTWWDDLPFLAFCLTRPDAQRRGLGAALISGAARSLEASGHRQVQLAVSRANPAVRLYERLGFREVPPPRL